MNDASYKEFCRHRPLAIRKDGTWYCYGHDITKNVWELFGSDGYIRTAYDYTSYGSVTSEGSTTQPVQWSSEVYDEELALVYYNYRHYNPMDGRWINRDPIGEQEVGICILLVRIMELFHLMSLDSKRYHLDLQELQITGLIMDLRKEHRTQGLARCNTTESYVGEFCCVITYCILRQDRAFYKIFKDF